VAGLPGDSVSAQILLYPNPAPGGSFYLSLPDLGGIGQANTQAWVIIRDVNGKTLLVTQLSASGPITHPLPAGTYFVTVRIGNTTATKKLTVL